MGVYASLIVGPVHGVSGAEAEELGATPSVGTSYQGHENVGEANAPWPGSRTVAEGEVSRAEGPKMASLVGPHPRSPLD